ncbi:acetoacetate--CoA ligase [Oceanisphaera arctica]|uniref:Acetoacetate--CoA ligase n=1 Tax=Oceanisphaera arctica TaxID=641510 RepID=A0A2P5TMT4_9GAMM|nr:acetoacetate--CoA ligase [Oceanisphaera arctica]PPL16778.1 acetoacetate--CoA ligase [Oceanisphaera arctica]GHA05829.1 acetoacetyl-CoA synthetase [Oceanisphaera arctica]
MPRQQSPLWRPSPARIKRSQLYEFMQQANHRYGLELTDYQSLHAWSVQDSATFWNLVWDFAEVVGEKGEQLVLNAANTREAVWFPEARLNFAENLLRHTTTHPAQDALLFQAEGQSQRRLSWAELTEQVAAIRAALEHFGVKPGDVVAGYLPNLPETLVAMLATAALGAIWTSTSPDFGADSVIDRFSQTRPKVLFSADGYRYNGKLHDTSDKARTMVAVIDSIEHWVQIPYIGTHRLSPNDKVQHWPELLVRHAGQPLRFTPMPFNAPLYVLYSSGTTGQPKCIIHSAGGILLNHLKEHRLHCDISPGDRVFYFTTCGWMMWNWLASALASDATLLLYEGSPFFPDGKVLWDWAEKEAITLFGTSAKYLEAMEKQQIHPRDHHYLGALRTLCSTGSALAPEQFDFVYRRIKSNLQLASIAGGTDICGCFVLGNPISPVYRGECQGIALGLDVQVFDEQGQPLLEQQGELVCCNSFPNRPLGFWGDDDGHRYDAAYWQTYPGCWHHGDLVALTTHGGIVFYGRSDTVLNPGGVRIGTAEIYRQVSRFEQIVDSVVIGQRWHNDERVLLFVKLADGEELNGALKAAIRRRIRSQCSPRHVPDKILPVADIPRTKSGKTVELAVRNVVENKPVKNIGALANPQSLALFRDLPELNE